MDLINEGKLQAAGDELIDRTKQSVEEVIQKTEGSLDGWTVTITIPEIKIKVELSAPARTTPRP